MKGTGFCLGWIGLFRFRGHFGCWTLGGCGGVNNTRCYDVARLGGLWFVWLLPFLCPWEGAGDARNGGEGCSKRGKKFAAIVSLIGDCGLGFLEETAEE
jgi:hypothetical protein